MKKTIAIAFFFSCISSGLYAQHRDGGGGSYSTGSSGTGTSYSNSNGSSSSSSSSSSGSSGSGSSYSSSNSSSSGNSSSDNRDNVNGTNGSGYNNSGNSNNNYYYYNNRRYGSNLPIHSTWYHSTCYLRLGLGYAFSMNGQTLNENSDPYSSTMSFDNNQHMSYTTLKKVSFSSGVQAVGALGWMLNKNIGIEVDGYWGVAPNKYTANFNGIMVDGSYPANIVVTNKAVSPIFVAPSFVLQTGGKKWGFYARSGPVIPVNGKVLREENYNFYNGGFQNTVSTMQVGTKITTTMNFGFTAATGVKYKLSRLFSLWTELSILSMSLDIKQEINTGYLEDGKPVELYPTINYGTAGNNVNRNNRTGTQPTYAEPFSNIAWNMGASINF